VESCGLEARSCPPGPVRVDLAYGCREGDAGNAESETGGGPRRRAKHEARAVMLDFGLGQRIEIGNDLGSGAGASERCDAILQRLLEHERKEVAEHMTADGLI
jgi:hypothetical protein